MNCQLDAHIAETGVNVLSPENQRRMISAFDEQVANYKKLGYDILLQICDAKYDIEGRIKNDEWKAWVGRSGAPLKRGRDGKNFKDIGLLGSGCELELDVPDSTIFDATNGFDSRNIETFLIRRSKEALPGETLNQLEIGPNTDIQAMKKGWPNNKRCVCITFVLIGKGGRNMLDNGEAKLDPCVSRFPEDFQRLRRYHPARHFLH